ncbi:MAG TPA: DUF3482 domain-containing protein [Burkholderiales bacterium]
MTTINLSLVSHTNVGKTTLMRTLTRQDIGEVADRPHVTEEAESHLLIETPEGDRLLLWDTPGFGDSARLLKRLRASANPIGWLLTQVWDRFADRPFFCSQRAIRNVSEESDVVLYLVNAAEAPAAAGYAEKELEILGWIGKPVVVLLNQMGPARGREAEALEEERWSRHLAAHVPTREAIALDAFARCWVQEDRLLGVVGGVLAAPSLPAFERLRRAWRVRNVATFDAAMHSIATQLAAAAIDRETADKQNPTEGSMNTLERRLVQAVRENTDQLIALHGLSGRARERGLVRLAGRFEVNQPVDVATAGAVGGMVSGALGGLAADIASGGLTLGAGAVIGAILGALGVGGAARAYNQAHGAQRWSAESLTRHFGEAILRYLAVAHYGRGRGDWVENEYPAHWLPLIAEVAARYHRELEPIWNAEGRTADEVTQQLRPLVSRATREVLERLYPEARELF